MSAQAHRVFLSYAAEDRVAALQVCAGLETAGYRCWMAPRDVRPGRSYPAEIMAGLEASAVVVLLVSRAACRSHMVRREVERAVNRNKPVIPLRLEDCAIGGDLEFLLASTQHIDAWDGPLQTYLDTLRAAVQTYLPEAAPAAGEKRPDDDAPAGAAGLRDAGAASAAVTHDPTPLPVATVDSHPGLPFETPPEAGGSSGRRTGQGSEREPASESVRAEEAPSSQGPSRSPHAHLSPVPVASVGPGSVGDAGETGRSHGTAWKRVVLLAGLGAVATLIAVVFTRGGETPPAAKIAASADMVPVPAGEFLMGCNAAVDKDCDDDEKPGRQVAVGAFKIDRTEVTVAAYEGCVDVGTCSPPGTGVHCNWPKTAENEAHPVNCVDWEQAWAYCKWAGKPAGTQRLPTEAEWEKAARGTPGRVYPWGNAYEEGRGNIGGGDGTQPVGRYATGASPYGVLDMAGNVWEWVHPGLEALVLRGGGWGHGPPYARASFRYGRDPRDRRDDVGFRCAQ